MNKIIFLFYSYDDKSKIEELYRSLLKKGYNTLIDDDFEGYFNWEKEKSRFLKQTGVNIVMLSDFSSASREILDSMPLIYNDYNKEPILVLSLIGYMPHEVFKRFTYRFVEIDEYIKKLTKQIIINKIDFPIYEDDYEIKLIKYLNEYDILPIEKQNKNKDKSTMFFIGDGACNIGKRINNINKESFYFINMNAKGLNIMDNNFLLFGEEPFSESYSLRCGFCKDSLIQNESIIKEIIGDSTTVFIVACMGGCTGGYISPEIARIARLKGCNVYIICTNPFEFEGPIKNKEAEERIKYISIYSDELKIFKYDDIFNNIDLSFNLNDAYKGLDINIENYILDKIMDNKNQH